MRADELDRLDRLAAEARTEEMCYLEDAKTAEAQERWPLAEHFNKAAQLHHDIADKAERAAAAIRALDESIRLWKQQRFVDLKILD